MLNRSLSDTLWMDASYLKSEKNAGALVFDEEKAAALKLESAQTIDPMIEEEIE